MFMITRSLKILTFTSIDSITAPQTLHDVVNVYRLPLIIGLKGTR